MSFTIANWPERLKQTVLALYRPILLVSVLSHGFLIVAPLPRINTMPETQVTPSPKNSPEDEVASGPAPQVDLSALLAPGASPPAVPGAPTPSPSPRRVAVVALPGAPLVQRTLRPSPQATPSPSPSPEASPSPEPSPSPEATPSPEPLAATPAPAAAAPVAPAAPAAPAPAAPPGATGATLDPKALEGLFASNDTDAAAAQVGIPHFLFPDPVAFFTSATLKQTEANPSIQPTWQPGIVNIRWIPRIRPNELAEQIASQLDLTPLGEYGGGELYEAKSKGNTVAFFSIVRTTDRTGTFVVVWNQNPNTVQLQ